MSRRLVSGNQTLPRFRTRLLRLDYGSGRIFYTAGVPGATVIHLLGKMPRRAPELNRVGRDQASSGPGRSRGKAALCQVDR